MRGSFRVCLVLVLAGLWGCRSAPQTVLLRPGVVDPSLKFIEIYQKGKLLLRQKLYAGAARAFSRAAFRTERGRTHFGAHYYLARCLLGELKIREALVVLERAGRLARSRRAEKAHYRTFSLILQLYGKVRLSSRLKPGDMPRLKLVLTPVKAFKNNYKKHYFRRWSQRVARQKGVSFSRKYLILPQGRYKASLEPKQCLNFGLFQSDKPVKELVLGASPITWEIRRTPSCRCPGDLQRYRTTRGDFGCRCPSGTTYFPKGQRCSKVWH